LAGAQAQAVTLLFSDRGSTARTVRRSCGYGWAAARRGSGRRRRRRWTFWLVPWW